MKKPQFITILVAVVALGLLLAFGKTVNKSANPHEGHDHDKPSQNMSGDVLTSSFSIDSAINKAKVSLSESNAGSLKKIESEISKAKDSIQKLHAFHQLSNFWKETGKSFIPFVWYTAEGARLENSEKNLNFAGHLFLDNLQQVEDNELRRWMALQAKDLFERSLKLNPDNDSTKVGIGATYLFGGISAAPMQGIAKIREVVNKDSTNIYAQMTLAMGSLMSGQSDLAKERLETVHRLDAKNVQAVLLLADLYERQGDKSSALKWYEKAIPLSSEHAEMKAELEKRVKALKQ